MTSPAVPPPLPPSEWPRPQPPELGCELASTHRRWSLVSHCRPLPCSPCRLPVRSWRILVETCTRTSEDDSLDKVHERTHEDQPGAHSGRPSHAETSTTPLVVWSQASPPPPSRSTKHVSFWPPSWTADRRRRRSALLVQSLTNAIVHSDSAKPARQITVRAQLHGSQLRVEVTDQAGPWAAHPSDPAGLHGRGLVILSRLADAWGAHWQPHSRLDGLV